MKVENMLKIKEEFDYKSLSRKLEVQLDKLIAENERQQKAFEDEVERINVEAQNRISEVETSFADALEVC
jgi:kinesin family protein 5